MISNFIAANADLAAKMAIAFTATVSMFWNEYVVPFNDKVIDTLQDLFFEMFDWLYKTATGAINSVFGFIDDSFNTISDILFTDLQKNAIIIMNGLSVIVPLLFPEATFIGQTLIGEVL